MKSQQNTGFGVVLPSGSRVIGCLDSNRTILWEFVKPNGYAVTTTQIKLTFDAVDAILSIYRRLREGREPQIYDSKRNRRKVAPVVKKSLTSR